MEFFTNDHTEVSHYAQYLKVCDGEGGGQLTINIDPTTKKQRKTPDLSCKNRQHSHSRRDWGVPIFYSLADVLTFG